MASTFKTFGSDDQTTTATDLNEVIPITGTIVSGTYSDNNIKISAHVIVPNIDMAAAEAIIYDPNYIYDENIVYGKKIEYYRYCRYISSHYICSLIILYGKGNRYL